MPDMRKYYNEQVRPALQEKLGLKNVMEIPKLKKIVLSTGIGTKMEKDAFSEARTHLSAIAGQAPVVCKSRKNIANFKLRAGMKIGVKVTLRGERMYEFMDKLFSFALPRVRDFKGINPDAFDGRGNYSLGLKEQLIFPEIEYDKVEKIRGMDIVFVTTANTDEEAKELLSLMGAPFAKN